MSLNLKQYVLEAGEHIDFSMHSFRSGGAVSRALAGDSLSSIMQRAFWKNPSTAWRYMRLMEVVSPGSDGNSMVEGVTENQYREINEFTLKEQSKAQPLALSLCFRATIRRLQLGVEFGVVFRPDNR